MPGDGKRSRHKILLQTETKITAGRNGLYRTRLQPVELLARIFRKKSIVDMLNC